MKPTARIWRIERNMKEWKRFWVLKMEDPPLSVPAEPGGVDAKEALAGPGEGG